MKTIKYFLSIFLIILTFNVSGQKILEPYKEGVKFSKKDVLFAKTELRKGMVSFVNSAKPYYEKGMSYANFQKAIIGKQSTSLPTEGSNLLKKAYFYLESNTSTDEILKKGSFKEIGAAYLFVKKGSQKKGVDVNLALFAKSTGDTFPNPPSANRTAGRCRWWQLRCHLQEIFGNDGGDSVLIAIINAIIGIF